MNRMISLAALGLAVSAAPALAQNPASDSRSQVVSYADLDLRSDADLLKLDRRIRAAIQDACGTPSDVAPQGKTLIRRCRAMANDRISHQRERAIASARQSPTTVLASQR